MSPGKPAIPDPTEIGGRYEVVKRLGAGAFGTVYKARDRELGRMVAIKTIRLEGLAASVAGLDELLKRFRVEARNAANLKHPNIVTIYDISEVEGLCYLAMEFIDGDGLDRILSQSGKLPVGRAAALVAQVADALHYAHKHRVIHRDIKPANIMVEAGDQVKLTDFGIAKATDSGEHLTMTGSLLGTPSYMSPEQARANPDLDGRSDLFSLGCVLYELLTGKKAFRGDSITAVLFKVVAEEPPPIAEVDPTIPEEMIRIVARALSKAPETRYQSGQEFADDLRVLAHPGSVPTLRQSDSPTTANHPTLSFDPTAQGTLATTPTVGSSPTVGPAPTQVRPAPSPPVPPPVPVAPTQVSRPPAPPPVPRSARPSPTRPKAGGGAGRLLALAGGALVLLLALAGGAWWILGRGTPPATVDATPEAASSPATPGEATAEAPPSTSPAEAPVAAGSAPTIRPTAVAPPPDTRTAAVPPTPVPPPSNAATPGASTRTTTARSAPPAATSAPASAAPDDSFLDSIPTDDSPDGRALAGELSRGFSSSGGNTSFGSSRAHNRRPVIPKHTLVEQPAVRTLAWILTAQKAHHRRTGRYGSFTDLVRARDLPLPPGSASGDGFERRGYRFVVKTTEEGFRADAQPLTPDGGRAFYVDEAGYVLDQ